MSKHTPGPWLISEDDLRQDPETVFSIGIWSGSTDPDANESVMVSTVSAFGLHSEISDGVEVFTTAGPEQREIDTAIANARLIADAPELLELLSRYVRQDRILGMTENNLYREACETIFKATGEQP